MAKKITKQLKMVIPAGKANPAPPVGPALGQAKVNIGEFVTRFNEGTKSMMGDLVPVVVKVYEDKTFDLIFKTPPASALILKAIGKEKGSGKNVTEKAGSISKAQIREIAEKKMKDLNALDVEGAMRIIEGSAKSMGVEVK
ncbi:MAG: 50S ribosomal protein L11 [Candidatus Taylorbacteria bacterium RIFCSPLOWO2_12_FULL_43_20]|uniref:Large ribosomal subunit protein uL11 n=1 Tax=Candidatus Taylorbacteria bacterium RIFCSPLOWO2_12_FULL_43_20 TaxID=1802332 RepID=A0A1G2P133_9BACT|nr:MAG: 50S ribosomal protein L11 [Candidatus Taylorbacteria bacterium RIFCSPHIGHO2_01_FULL_43_120]OHA22187.1 MAG: 50S ribosomal protein L11 [Candidatus Taylorbacteria bacterium RIFCSPHIGHO2_02_FULL_43_55]OHA28037.1 MAG: 50S ribosomal protein L11 [Candidatus Taylorbacteria bacterium RIFCSPHIGHO2_12_FULL_42_34]OHA32270.1 MAG: 50S ribosomal protein L11 [Candidatus Taylorbacteria bacterium RIFCSPLOWO2_01_FULL_43_83]OHA37863.1 MAG: 50S ribosomal protein L11 [Candidatus Taylorbacteria bacterium RIFC